MQTEFNETVIKPINAIRESSVYSGIQNSVQTKDASTFSLLLAMVTKDALELDEFHLPRNKPLKTVSDLEKTFHIVPQKLVEKANNQQDLLLNELVSSGNRESLTLFLKVHPQAFITTNDDIKTTGNLPKEVYNNLDINQQAKLYQDIERQADINDKHTEDNAKTITTAKPTGMDKGYVEMDIDSWFSALEQSRNFSKVA
ncbi:VC2046/SO_2500 family protein [uncultured Psychrosphaera sp.]|uniref:VC2046/SO_2500 family protein n=1 Tax=uncultured Psychrosphaera sp. TaxID=1403522 RepID=UPI00262619D8|nr:VC2046/SO_2500 family protein [uncultured Psychrosphaera sp.]